MDEVIAQIRATSTICKQVLIQTKSLTSKLKEYQDNGGKIPEYILEKIHSIIKDARTYANLDIDKIKAHVKSLETPNVDNHTLRLIKLQTKYKHALQQGNHSLAQKLLQDIKTVYHDRSLLISEKDKIELPQLDNKHVSEKQNQISSKEN